MGGLYYLVFGTLWGIVLVLTAVNYVRLVADRRRKRLARGVATRVSPGRALVGQW